MDKNKNKIDLLYSGMDEWKLQEYLTKKWRKQNLVFEGSDYRLVCWELMFHSWEINDNRAKWDEISIDFIFYSIELAEFLCIELKNIIKGRRKLLLAYCQASQRTDSSHIDIPYQRHTNGRIKICWQSFWFNKSFVKNIISVD